jgi:hypothetical protein
MDEGKLFLLDENNKKKAKILKLQIESIKNIKNE